MRDTADASVMAALKRGFDVDDMAFTKVLYRYFEK